MASGSQNMTTYNARTVTGSNSAASPAGALLLSGEGRADDATGDTWLFLDSAGGTSTPWGIKHDQANNKIHIYGSNTDSVWTRMNTGDTYILGKVGIGYDPEESGNSYKLYVNGSSYFTDTIIGDATSAWHILGGRPTNTTNFNTHFETVGNLHHDNPTRTDVELTYNRFFLSNSDQTTYGPSALHLPVVDQHVLSFGIDNGAAYSRHMAFDIRTNAVYVRARTNNTWGNWEQLVRNTGTWNISITGNADTVDNYHASSFYIHDLVEVSTSANQDGLWGSTGSRSYHNVLPDGLSGVYAYGQVISFSTNNSARFQIYAPHTGSSNQSIYFRTGWGTDKKQWRTILHDGNYNNYAPTKTGGGASGTWGISITGHAASATTVYGRTSIAKGTNPSATIWPAPSWFVYETGSGTAVANRVAGGIESYIDANGMASLCLRAYQHTSGSTNTNSIEIRIAKNGTQTYTVSNAANFRSAIGVGASGTHADSYFALASHNHDSSYVNISGDTMTGNLSFSNSGTAFRGINYGTMGDNDQWRVGGAATGSNAGYMEIATADDGNEPIYVRQYTGVFSSVKRTLTLLDASGNTVIPGSIYFNNKGTNIIYNGPNDAANGVGGALNNLVFSAWYGVSFTTSCASQTYTNKNAVSINCRNGHLYAAAVHNAVWNDLGECRISNIKEPGYAINAHGEKTINRLEAGTRITSDTYGFLLGDEENQKTAPVAISGRVLAYPYKDKSEYKIGDAVCSAPGGTIDVMTREEIMMYPDRIIGIVNEIPDYDIWEPSREGGGARTRTYKRSYLDRRQISGYAASQLKEVV